MAVDFVSNVVKTIAPLRRRLLIRLLFLLLLALLASCGGGGSNSGGGPPPPQNNLQLSASPQPLNIFPGSTFVLSVTATANNSSTPMITSVQLPSGIAAVTTFPAAVPSSGVSITFQTSSTIAAGNYTLTLNGSAGPASSSANVSATVPTYAPPQFSFANPLFTELGVPIGGSAQIQISTLSSEPGGESPDYTVQLSLSRLPTGTSATITPEEVVPGQPATVAITATSTSPPAQNVTVTVTGTPQAAGVDPVNLNLLVDVTSPPGSLPDNRTDYLFTDDAPFAAVYDSVHGLIFSSNPSWNRIDVISSTTHAIVTRIPIRGPQGIDITQDSSMVWVATASRQVFSINTSSFAVTRYLLPAGSIGYWEGAQLFALSDGTLMMDLSQGPYTGIFALAIWNPITNAITFPNPPNGVTTDGLYRSGDANRVYFIDSSSAGAAFYYNVPTKQFSSPATLAGYALNAAVNVDSTRVVICDTNGPNLYDGNFNLIGPVPACGFAPPFFLGGSVFSADNLYLYQEGGFGSGLATIFKIDPNTLNILSIAPAMPLIPTGVELSQGYYLPYPFGVDTTGMIFGIENQGIAFDDAAFVQNYAASQPGSPTFMQHMSPYSGPLAGGTASSGFGNAFSLTPDVWYGANHGTAQLSSGGTVTITSPPGSGPGPVNVKMLFPDGSEVFDPQFFSYGPFIQYAVTSGAPPQGNVAALMVGDGLPSGSSNATLTVGGSTAALGSLSGSYPGATLEYTIPAGNPGPADIVLTTPDGTFTAPKAMFYAQSVTDYASSDTFAAILYDPTRQQLYLSAGDHIDVFSLTSNQFLTPLTPPSVQGSAKQFAGLALTPDGSMLLVGDTADASLAAINPDNPSQNYAVAVTAPSTTGCNIGPLYVAPTSNNKAFVVTGALPGSNNCFGGSLYEVDLTARTSGPPPVSGSCTLSYAYPANYVASAQNGANVAIGGSLGGFEGFCIYNVSSNTYTSNSTYDYGAAFSSDGNVAGATFVLTDSSANTVGRIAQPSVFYGYLVNAEQSNLAQPQFNASGSLYFMAYPSFVDIIDVQHAILRMRFSLSETVSNAAAPLAVDSGGRYIYLITNKSLSIVDLGQAPLSVGWLNPAKASPGSQITIRGSGFDSSTTATVGGQTATVSVTDPNTLTLTIPSLSPGPAGIVLTNSSGTQYSAPGLLTIQ
jgi:hypothetical protein